MTAIEIAHRFVTARRHGHALSEFPGAIPQSLSSAYAVQDAAIATADTSVVGWKVGRIFPPLSDTYGADRLAGPIFSAVLHNSGEPPVGRIFAGGFGAAEAEFLMKVASDLPVGKQDYSLQQATDVISAIHVGIEIASSPLASINDLGPPVIIADFGNNNGLVVGPEIEDWETSAYAEWDIALQVDGQEIGRGSADNFPDGPVGSVRFLLNNLGSRGIPVTAGTWISTGAITGVHEVAAGQKVHAYFGEQLSVNCTIEAAPVS